MVQSWLMGLQNEMGRSDGGKMGMKRRWVNSGAATQF